jgi:16S rRNA G966 N2-methylase RsmD
MGDTFVQTPSIVDSLKNSDEELIVYIDPPFDYRDGMEDIYTKSFEMIKKFKNENIYMIIIEHVSTLDIPEELGLFTLNKTKKFGKSSLSYFSLREE